jgi:hypothetical protein
MRSSIEVLSERVVFLADHAVDRQTLDVSW